MGYVESLKYRVVECDQLGTRTVGEYETLESANIALLALKSTNPQSNYRIDKDTVWAM